MSEEQILNAITSYCQDDKIVFQIITQNTKLYIYVNREPEDNIDHKKLKNNILLAISDLDNLNIREVYLYSRISGNIEPDWQATVDLKQINTDKTIDSQQDKTESGIEAIDSESDLGVSNFAFQDKNEVKKISAVDLPYEPQVLENYEISSDIKDNLKAKKTLADTEIDLKSYYFIRNKTLLSSELLAPKFNIAQLIKTFHEFSRSVQEKQLPILNDYFHKSCNPSTANFNAEIKSWWNTVLDLNSEEKRKTAIWLSRYCFNSEETLSIIESVFIAKASIEEAEKQTLEAEKNIYSSTEYSQKISKQDERVLPSSSKNKRDNTTRNLKVKSKKDTSPKINLFLPIIWLFITLSFAIIDLHKPLISHPVACENIAAENKAYCSLAAKIVGEESLNAVISNLPKPLKEEENLVSKSMMEKGLLNCELYGNIAAGVPFKEAASSKIAPLSSSTKEILSGFYVADVEQTNLKEGNPTVRTACFFYRVKKISKPYDIKFLAMDQIDVEWPTVAYEPTEKIKSLHTLNKTVRTYSFLSIFGINTFFTAITIYLIAISGMAIRVDSLETIYQASFILGMTKSILSFLPVIGFLALVPMECVALGITSSCVKGFKIDWNCGYPFVAATALLLIVLRTLFSFLFMGFLSIVFG